MAEATPLLSIRDLTVSYRTRRGRLPAVVGFDLDVHAGEAVGLVGESGCGKSTVAYAVMRHLGAGGRIERGRILFEGRDLLTLPARALARLRGSAIAMVHQEPMAALNPSLTVGHQLAEVPVCHERISWREARERALDMLAAVHLPDPARIYAAYPHQLSGGQQQRVVIAMALLARPRLLLLDEPTTALDVTVEAGIVALVREIAARFGTAMIYISHDLGLIRETCDRITVMYAGEAVESGPVEQVFRHMRHPYTRGLFRALPRIVATDGHHLEPIPGQPPRPHERPAGCLFAPRCRHVRPGLCDRPQPLRPVPGTPDHLVRCARFGEVAAEEDPPPPPPPRRAPGATVLRVEELTKHYGGGHGLLARLSGRARPPVVANRDVRLEAREAETVAIIGESGCGKSTLGKVVVGLEPATAGRILFRGRDLAALPVDRRPRDLVARIQMVFQNPAETLNPSHRIGHQLARAVRRLAGVRNRREVHARVSRLLELVRLPPDVRHRHPDELSGGQKQRVGIARAFAGTPDLVVADEPVSALDVSVQAAIVRLLDDIQRAHGTTLLFIAHDLALVRRIADRVVVLYLGQVMESGPTERVFAPPYHPYTEALLAAVPLADPDAERRRILLEGDPPSPADPPGGCPFHTRCPRRLGEICAREPPPERVFADGHRIRCHLDAATLASVPPVVRPLAVD